MSLETPPKGICRFCLKERVLVERSYLCWECRSNICGNCGMMNAHDVSEAPCVECDTYTYQGWTFDTLEALEEWQETEFD